MRAPEFPARFFVLAASLLTARLYQKVSEAKSRPDAYGSNKPWSVNKHVIQWNLKIHIAVCVIPVVLLMPIEIFLHSPHLEDYFLVTGILMKQVEMHIIWAHALFLFPPWELLSAEFKLSLWGKCNVLESHCWGWWSLSMTASEILF